MKIRDKIFIFFIIVFSSGYAFGWNNAKAMDGFVDVCTHNYTANNTEFSESFYVSESAFQNETQFSVGGRNYIKPVAYYDVDGTVNGSVTAHNISIFAYGSNSIAKVDSRTNYYNNSLSSTIYIWSDADILNFNYLPVFDNYDDASAYSCGLEYNIDNMIGGYIPINWQVDSQTRLENTIIFFDKTINPFKIGTASIHNIGYTVKYKPNYNINDYPNVHRIFEFTCKGLNNTAIQQLMLNEAFTSSLPVSSMGAIINTTFQSGVYAINSHSDNLTTFKITLDEYELINNPLYAEYASIGVNSDGTRDIQITDLIGSNTLNSMSIMNNGLFATLIRYYGSRDVALYALPYITFEKIETFCSDPTSGKVYNPIYTFWIDLTKSDGTIVERRNFGGTLDIVDSDIDGTLDDTEIPNLDIPTNKQNQLYNQTIQDSYNNTYNYYYNDSSYNQDLLDYLYKYRDGGTQQDIQDAFGYLNSTIDSVSNVPLLLGKAFTGFFPNSVITLLSAIFVVFAVFLIIIIIKHLFL